MINVLDLFCGTGALSYGLHNHDERFDIIGGIDADMAACATARANNPKGTFVCAPIESVAPRKFQDLVGSRNVDVIVGGPPCQGFSSLRPNRNSNVNDPRNSLYKNFFEYVRFFEPRVVLMENVVGLIGASNGSLLDDIMQRFKKLGYAADWKVLNAANFGVPQKRERVIFLGVRQLRGKSAKIVYPVPSHFFDGRVIGTRHRDRYLNIPRGAEPALTVVKAISDLPKVRSGEQATRYGGAPKNAYQRERRKGAARELSLHVAANHSEEMLRVIRVAGASRSALPTGLVSGGFSSCYSRLEPNEPATTITVKFTSPASNKCIHPKQDRAITPREAARLQGFDDAFTFCGSKTDIAAQIGNAIPPLLGKALAPALMEYL